MGCHINMTLFLETSMFGQGTLVLPLKKREFLIAYVPQIIYVLWRWQRCNLLGKNRAGISVWYKTFQVFIVLIAVTPVQLWSKAKGTFRSSEGTVGEIERWGQFKLIMCLKIGLFSAQPVYTRISWSVCASIQRSTLSSCTNIQNKEQWRPVTYEIVKIQNTYCCHLH